MEKGEKKPKSSMGIEKGVNGHNANTTHANPQGFFTISYAIKPTSTIKKPKVEKHKIQR